MSEAKPDSTDLLAQMRLLESDSGPDGWPAVKMRDISALCTMVESAIPSLDLLQAHLDKGAYLSYQDNEWHLFRANGEGIVSGKNIREILMNLIWTKC